MCESTNLVKSDENEKSCNENNVGLKIMKRMSYKGKGLGKNEQGMEEPIEPVMRPKHEGIGYLIGKGNNAGSSKFVRETQCIQCSYCSRKGHTKDECWNLHPCSICGLGNHCEKMCWNKNWKSKPMTGCMQMDCGWNYGSSWKKITNMLKMLYRCSYVKYDRNQAQFVGLVRHHEK